MTTVDLYWITRLDSIRSFCWAIIVATVIYLIVGLLIYALQKDVYDTRSDLVLFCQKHYKLLLIMPLGLVLVSMIVLTFLPSTKEMLIIQGIDKITQSPEIKNLVGLIYEKLQALLMSK